MNKVPLVHVEMRLNESCLLHFFIKIHIIVNKSVFVLNPFDNVDICVKVYPTFKSWKKVCTVV